jgi:hypothetical protein
MNKQETNGHGNKVIGLSFEPTVSIDRFSSFLGLLKLVQMGQPLLLNLI